MSRNVRAVALLLSSLCLALSFAQAQGRAVDAESHPWWQHAVFYALTVLEEGRFLRGRLRYVGADGGEAPFAQLVIVFRPGLARPWVMKPWEWRPRSKQNSLNWLSRMEPATGFEPVASALQVRRSTN